MTEPVVKQVLRNRGSSIAWLGRKVGISRTGLSRRLDGKLRFQAGEAERIAEALDLPIEVVIPASPQRERVA